MIKKKILLYTGNHALEGIHDYVQNLKIMSKKMGFILHIKNNISYEKINNYNSIIFIEQFFLLESIETFLKISNLFKGKKILILTEFFNKSEKTLNNFENIYIKKINYLIVIYYKFINFLILSKTFTIYRNISKTFSFLYNLLIKVLSLIVKQILCLIILIIASLTSLLLFQKKLNLNILEIERRYKIYVRKFKIINRFKSRKKIQNYLNQKNISLDQFNDYVLMKKRYSSLMLFINRFDLIFRSHSGIELDNVILKNFPFYLPCNLKLFINKKEKIKLTFSGFLNSYRIKELEKFLENKNSFFDYSLIERILKSQVPRFIKQPKETNVCSLHLKKSKNWPYSSPTRYINSLKKNEIPIVLDQFNDDLMGKLYLGKDFLNCQSYDEVNKYLDELETSLKEYRNYIYKFEQNFNELFNK